MVMRNKERLMTLGVVLVICSVAIVLPGCAPLGVVNPEASPVVPHHMPYLERCSTDMECEMQEAARSRSNDTPRWKMWTSIGVGVLVTGWLYARNQDKGGGAQALGGGDKSIQPVTCAAKGCAF